MPNTTQRLVAAGVNTALGVAQEATFGTAVAPSIYLPFEAHNLAVKNALITDMAVRQNIGMPLPGMGTVSVAGDVTTYVDTGSIGLLLGASLGQGSDTVTGAGPYVHTMKMTKEANSYTFSADDSNGSVSQFVGCKVSGLDLSAKAGDFLKVKATIEGQGNTVINTPLSPTIANVNFLEFQHLTASTINATSVEIADFHIQLKNTIKPMFNSMGGRFASGMTTVQREVTGSMTINYDGTIADLINTQLWGTSAGTSVATTNLPTNALVLTFTIGASSILTISVPAFTISEAPLNRKRGDILQHAVKFIASATTSSANDDMKLILTNSASAAYA